MKINDRYVYDPELKKYININKELQKEQRLHKIPKKYVYPDTPEKKEYRRQYGKKYRETVRAALSEIKLRYGCQNPMCPVGPTTAGELDFHHSDPTKKEIGVSKLMTRDRNKAVTEIEKCNILCAICHRRVHLKIIQCDFPLVKVLSLEYCVEKFPRRGTYQVESPPIL